MNQLENAIKYAADMHQGQQYGQQPYTFHLNEVQRFIVYFELYNRFQNILIGAWLHDVLEDTDATIFDINNKFGDSVAKLVNAVTDGIGKTRQERKAQAYKKIQKHGAEATALKLADRIANVSFSKATNVNLFEMYTKEYKDFRKALYNPSHQLEEMWDYLDNLINE